MRLEAFSNGLGAQSMALGWLAKEGKIPARLSITADTGGENDCLWSSGRRSTLREYFEEIARPVLSSWGVEAVFVRAKDGRGTEMPTIDDFHRNIAPNYKQAKMPLFGSNNGRLKQSCTDRWKGVAIRQEGRRRGATHLRTAQGIHAGEAARRVKGIFIGRVDGFDTYQKTQTKDGITTVLHKWCSHYYPLVGLRMVRNDCCRLMESLSIPYLISTECDKCPHKNAARWLRSSPEAIREAADFEALFEGKQFLTERRRPLPVVIQEFKEEMRISPSLFDTGAFDCTDGLCGV